MLRNDLIQPVRFPAEWEPQSGIMLALPSEKTDWAPLLASVLGVYAEIIAAVTRFEKVLLLCDNYNTGGNFLVDSGLADRDVILAEVPFNDTWTRDYGPLTVLKDGKPVLLDFMFNGWGLKFAADMDNLVTAVLAEKEIFNIMQIENGGIVLEGGSIESDGDGTVLVTSRCLLSPNRNPSLSKEQIGDHLMKKFGASRVLWLNSGELDGDDTDAHIDTLARLAPDNTILYMSAAEHDSHHNALKEMENELVRLVTADGARYKLQALPLPPACYDAEGYRLPATYANYLVINGAVLVPVYGDDATDTAALKIIGSVFTGREIIPINCRPLIEQHGSLHCVTMQFPEGVL